MTTKINVHLHDAQQTILESSARFKIIACGRRFGKTTLDIAVVLLFAAQNPGATIWWVTPRYELGEEARKELLDAIPPQLRTPNESRRITTLWNGARIFYRSADTPDNLRAVGIDLLVIDEGAFIKAERWYRELRPTLADSRAPAILTSTFNGENWFYDLFLLGLDPDYPEYESFRYPTSANPFISRAEIEEAKRTTPRAEFEQEWEANPLVYVGAVFDGETIFAAQERGLVPPQRTPQEQAKMEHFGAIDWGYTHPTVFLVNEEQPATGRVRWLKEHLWVGMPLGPDATKQRETRIDNIVAACREHRILVVYADAEDPNANVTLADTLEQEGLPTEVRSVPFNKWKMIGITARRWFLEQGLEDLGPECPELIRTSKGYRWKEGKEDRDTEKVDDDPVDAATAFYASRRVRMVGG